MLHQKTVQIIAMRLKRPLLWIVLITAFLFAGVHIQFESIVSPYINTTLADLEIKTGYEITFDKVYPAGFRGVVLEGVTFSSEGQASGQVERLLVRPDFWSLFQEDLSLLSVGVESAAIQVPLHWSGELYAVSNETGIQREESPIAFSGGDICSPFTVFPEEVHLADVQIATSEGAGERALPRLLMEEGTLLFTCDEDGPAGELSSSIRVDNSPGEMMFSWMANSLPEIGIRFDDPISMNIPVDLSHGLSESSQLSFSSLTFLPQGTLTVENLTAGALNLKIPGIEMWRLDGVSLSQVMVQRISGGLHVLGAEGAFELEGILKEVSMGFAALFIGLPDSQEEIQARALFNDDMGGELTLDLGFREAGRLSWIDLSMEQFSLGETMQFLPDELGIEVLAGLVDGDIGVAFEERSGAQGEMEIVLDLQDVQIEAPFISSHPIEGLSLGLETLSHWNESWFDCGMTRLDMGDVPVHLTCGLDLEQTGSDAFHMNLYLPPVSASILREALPSGIVPSIRNSEFSGEIEGLFELLSPMGNLLDSYVDLRLDLSQVEVGSLPERLAVAQLADAIEIEVSPTGERHRHVGPKRADWVSYNGVSSLLFDALVNAEDGRFWEHNGFDRQSLIGAFRDNISQGRVVRGGSTISQQLARSLYLGQERSLGRKLEEAFLTWQIESHLDKEQILEWYVNTVHWGQDVYGIREASSHYFSVLPEQLSLTESVFLASILSNPNLYGSQYLEGEISQSRQDKSCNILQNMYLSGLLDEIEHSVACESIRQGRISPSQEHTELIYPAVHSPLGDPLVSFAQP